MAYGKHDGEPLFTDLKDLRPTFYGFIVAYKLLGERKYLDAAVRGADWFVRNAVDKGAFTGVCGDARFINDFATGQAVQALLDMHGLTGEARYRDAALRTARMYATSIYTHPTPGDREIEYKGRKMQEWQISQVGLCFEHGGCAGSAVSSTSHGPRLRRAKRTSHRTRTWRPITGASSTGVPVPSRIMRGGSWGGSPITSSPKPKCGAVAESRSPAVS